MRFDKEATNLPASHRKVGKVGHDKKLQVLEATSPQEEAEFTVRGVSEEKLNIGTSFTSIGRARNA